MNPDAVNERAQILDDDDFVYTRTVNPTTKEVKVWSGGYRIRSPLLEGIVGDINTETGRTTVGGRRNKQKQQKQQKVPHASSDNDTNTDADADATLDEQDADTDPNAYAVPFGLHVVMSSCGSSAPSFSNPFSTLTDTFQRAKHIDDDLFDRLFALSQFATTPQDKTMRQRTLRAPRSHSSLSPSSSPSSSVSSTTKTRRTRKPASNARDSDMNMVSDDDADDDDENIKKKTADTKKEEEKEEEENTTQVSRNRRNKKKSKSSTIDGAKTATDTKTDDAQEQKRPSSVSRRTKRTMSPRRKTMRK